MNEENNVNEVKEKKKGNKTLIICIAIIGLALLITGLVMLFTNKSSDSSSNKESENKKEESSVEMAQKFEGIYKADVSKLYIHKINNTEFSYTLDGNGFFQGVAKVTNDTAIEKNHSDAYFEFKLADNGVEVIYHADENTELAADTGLFTRVADYNKDNIYKEAVGDPIYLTSKYSGIFKNGEIELYAFQINEKEVSVNLIKGLSDSAIIFNEKFEIVEENKLIAKSFFDENENSYEITFNGDEFSLKCNENVFGFHEENKQLELTYKFERALTQDDIMNEFLSNY